MTPTAAAPKVAPPEPGVLAESKSPKQGAVPSKADKTSFLTQRLVSLDVYRGVIMITLAFNGFGLAATATNHLRDNPNSELWTAVHHHFEHVEWTGCGYW